jgi:hypothetical protein
MSKDVEQLAEELAELAARIEAKVKEFDEQGVLHGPPRKAAASLKMQQERAAPKAASGPVNAASAIADELTANIGILKDTFEHRTESIYAVSERKTK